MTLTVPPTSDETQSSEPSCLERRKTRPRIDQHVGHDLARRGVDEMRHVRGFGRVYQHLAVRAYAHALRLHADLNLADLRPLRDVDDRYGIVVLVGDVKRCCRWDPR